MDIRELVGTPVVSLFNKTHHTNDNAHLFCKMKDFLLFYKKLALQVWQRVQLLFSYGHVFPA